jgi:para-nitrobenzyl esterase
MGEDCLSLNVWAPASGDGPFPVMFWIHGGAYIAGSGQGVGPSFARDGVVLVSINYRLGALGFLHAGSLDDRWSEASGNYALADMVAALEWVRDNIANFGGDPGNVTVFGISAGGVFTSNLVVCPRAGGLFQKGINQSAGGTTLYGIDRGVAAAAARLLLAQLGVEAGDLPSLGWEQIVESQTEFLADIQHGKYDDVLGSEQGIPFTPVDGDPDYQPRPVIEATAAGVGSDIDLIVGTCRDEYTTFALMGELTGRGDTGLAARPWSAPDELQRRVRDVYERTPIPNVDLDTQIVTDRVFRVPNIRLAENHARNGGQTRMYCFAWPSPVLDGRLGACHGIDVGFTFDDLGGGGMTALMLGADPPQALATAMHGAWVSFARTGDPAQTGHVPAWPRYRETERATMILDEECRVEPDPMGDRRAVWDGVDLSH